MLPADAFAAFASDDAYIRHRLDAFAAEAAAAGKPLAEVIAAQTFKGEQPLPLTRLTPHTEYVVCAFGVTTQGKAISELFKESFTTSMPTHLENIGLEIADLEKYSVSVTFTPSTDLLTYYGSIIDKAYFDELGSDEANIRDDLEYFALLAENEKTDVASIIAKYTHKGQQTLPYDKLRPKTEYIAYAFGVNTDGTVTSTLFKQPFTTPEPGPSENRITLSVSKIGIDGALISATTTNDDPYILDVWEASKLGNMTDEEIIRTLLASYAGYDIDKEIATRGDDAIDATGQIDPTEEGTECIALAFGYEAGTVTTALVKEEFKTKPGDWVECVFTITQLSLNSRSASFRVTAADPEGNPDQTTPFFFTTITPEKLAAIGNTDEAIGAYLTQTIRDEAEYMGYPLETYIRLILFRGEKTESYTELTPQSEFYIVAAGVNTQAKIITQVARSEKFTVPAPSSATVTFGTPSFSGKTVTVPVQAGAGTPKWKAAGMGSSSQYMSDSAIISHLLGEFVGENTTPTYVFDTSYESDAYFYAIGLDASGNPGNLVKLTVPLGN